MNVLVVSIVFPPEPVVSSKLSFDISEGLAEAGHNVTVVCPKPTRPFGYNFNKEETNLQNFKKVVLDSYTYPESDILGRMRESFSFGLHSSRYLIKNHKNIDVVYANTWPVFAQLFIAIAAKRHKVPFVLHIQDIYPESLAGKQKRIIRNIILSVFLPIDRFILRKCTKIIAISSNMKDYLSETRNIDPDKIFVVRNWQNDSDFMNVSKSVSVTNSLFTFMFLGSISPSAGVETLIHAFGKAGLTNCRLIIAGEGSKKSDCVKASKNYPAANIDFIDAPSDKVHVIQQDAAVLLLPLKKGISLTATPSKLAAYLFSGKPVIACVETESDTGVCISEAECGIVIEPENEEKLAEAMGIMFKSDSWVLDRFGRNGIKFAVAHLSRKVNLSKIISIIAR